MQPVAAYENLKNCLEQQRDQILYHLVHAYFLAAFIDYENIHADKFKRTIAKLKVLFKTDNNFHFAKLFAIIIFRHLELMQLYWGIYSKCSIELSRIEEKNRKRSNTLAFLTGICGIITVFGLFGATASLNSEKIPCLEIPEGMDKADQEKFMEKVSKVTDERRTKVKIFFQALAGFEEFHQIEPIPTIIDRCKVLSKEYVEGIHDKLNDTRLQRAETEVSSYRALLRRSVENIKTFTKPELKSLDNYFNLLKKLNIKPDDKSAALEFLSDEIGAFVKKFSRNNLENFKNQIKSLKINEAGGWMT